MHEGMHHYHTRKRIHHHFEQWPHPNALKRFIDRMVYVVGFFAIAMTVPQFYEVWINKNAAGVSALSWGAYSFTSLFWFFYGILHKERPLMINYGIWVLLNGLIAAGALIYG
ncbi:hypothetical protein A3B36_01765 [Candidatus Uhrbacteria bacterium RIFCSPLOWO2_01_FULL_55_36]|uniref:MtN3 and saliva related transmembrane protein n=1 Tax=Candidatus Uhrbacteria bacterium RIFCSPLOWO2_01_FULL_55_36 TaxID=1802404 RepID=A0A1F7V185_9BACT|nr:MAG: hypothetical protein A3B36_01765 [Candidatus Uhrbacteria bacterium RIFCSPLOWO2_01_FULL_55_36]